MESRPPEVPKCTQHQLPARLYTCRRPNSEHAGRQFYRCSMPIGPPKQQCDFFVWLDADPQPSSQSSSQTVDWPPTPRSVPNSQEPPSTPTPSMKRNISTLGDHGDGYVGASPASIKRMRIMEAALSEAGPSAPLKPLDFKSTPTPSATTTKTGDVTTTNVAWPPETPHRSLQNRIGLTNPSRIASPMSMGFRARQTSYSRDLSTEPESSQPTLPDGDELNANSVASMIQQLGALPEYVRKLEKKKNAAEKSRDAKDSKIAYLQSEVDRLKARERQLEDVIAALEGQDD